MSVWDELKNAGQAKLAEAQAAAEVAKNYVGSQLIKVVAPEQQKAMDKKFADSQKALKTAQHRSATAKTKIGDAVHHGVDRRVDPAY